MTVSIPAQVFVDELATLLTETFESVEGIYLDRGTSLLETLADITAAEASIPVGNRCATIAAQVTHVCFFLDLADEYIRTGQDHPVDWGEIWRTVSAVSPAEWDALRERMRQTYLRTMKTVKTFDHWEEEHSLGGAMGLLAHTAYHLGEIRQATCTVKA